MSDLLAIITFGIASSCIRFVRLPTVICRGAACSAVREQRVSTYRGDLLGAVLGRTGGSVQLQPAAGSEPVAGGECPRAHNNPDSPRPIVAQLSKLIRRGGHNVTRVGQIGYSSLIYGP